MLKFLEVSLTIDVNTYCADISAADFSDDTAMTALYLEVNIFAPLEAQ